MSELEYFKNNYELIELNGIIIGALSTMNDMWITCSTSNYFDVSLTRCEAVSKLIFGEVKDRSYITVH